MYLNFTIDDQDKIIGEGVIQACQVGESFLQLKLHCFV